MRFFSALLASLLFVTLDSAASGQDVVSARSGTVDFTEGQVFIDNHALDRKSGSFPSLKEGSTLRTGKGRAEVLLTPGVFLRLDENSAIQMIATELADTRLAFLNGSAILDQSDAARATGAITVTYKDTRTQFPQKGVYRYDGDTGVLQVYSGEADVSYNGEKTKVDPGHLFFCWLGLQTAKLGNGTEDEFYDWANDRNQAIAEQNQLAQQTNQDPGDVDPDLGGQAGSGVVPYGAPGVAPPAIGPPSYSYNIDPYAYGGGYAFGSPFFNPFLGFGAAPFFPLGYPALVVVRPVHHTTRPLWPHSTGSTVWSSIGSGPRLTPILPTRLGGVGIGSAAVGGYHPIAPPRVGSGVRPAAPAISRPIAIHPAIGRR